MISANEPGVVAILAALGTIGGITPTTLTPTSSVVTVNGTVAANKYYVEFIFSSDFVGTINGVAFTGAALGGKSFPNIYPNKYPAISYTISAGSLTITSF